VILGHRAFRREATGRTMHACAGCHSRGQQRWGQDGYRGQTRKHGKEQDR
jgi:hypothetical protein